MLLQDALGWWPWETPPVLEVPVPFNLTTRAGEEVGWDWLDGGIRVARIAANAANLNLDGAEGRSSAGPEQWDSRACMDSWGVPQLQREVDPRGYVVFSEGRCDALTSRVRMRISRHKANTNTHCYTLLLHWYSQYACRAYLVPGSI